MNTRETYSYTILRYVHDALTGEFVNVGVVLFVPMSGGIRFKTRVTIARLKGIFPDIERSAFTSAIQAVRRGLQAVAKQELSPGLLNGDCDAAIIARKAVPADDSALQWSPCGTGLTDNPDRTLTRLFERYVSRYDTHSRNRKTDDDVWRPVRLRLEERNLSDLLQEKSISGALDDISFKHAWKNGQWHVYEPLSFDLVDAEGIKGKAREWLGHLSAVVDGGSAEQFKAHFVVGPPQNTSLDGAYRTAIAILKAAPNKPEVFEEAELDALIAQIENEVRAHDAASH